MYTIYHFNSVAEITDDVVDAIKTAFQGKAVVLTIEEEKDTTAYLAANAANKAMIERSLQQARAGEFIEVKPEDL